MWGKYIVEILSEDRPTIKAVNPTSWIKKTDYREQEFKPSLQAFTTQRAGLLAVLKPLAPDAWLRMATVTGAGKPRELDQIGEARMDQGGVNGHWSIKDIVAHLTGWNRHLIARLQAAQRGEGEPPPPWPVHLQTEDEINAWIYESDRGCSVREVLSESHQVFQQLLAVIEGVPDEVRIDPVHQGGRVYLLVWLDGQRFPAGEFFDHFHDDHEPDVRAWLARVEKQ